MQSQGRTLTRGATLLLLIPAVTGLPEWDFPHQRDDDSSGQVLTASTLLNTVGLLYAFPLV